MTLLVLRDVTRTVTLPDLTPLRILRGVDLDVEPGEHLAIVGRSGTGKSTLLNILGLLDSPTSGWYFIDGEPVARMSSGRRARLRGDTFGFVFQQFNLLPGRSALDNVVAPLLYAGGQEFWQREEIAARMLDSVGLGDRLDDDPVTLSGGEQQRVAIARSLVRSPRVILADEPTGALDVETGGRVIDLLEDIAASTGAALITITHDLAVAARAPRQYRMEDGVLRETDAGDVLAAAQTADVADAPDTATADATEPSAPSPSSEPARTPVAERIPDATRAPVAARAARRERELADETPTRVLPPIGENR